MGTQIVNCPFCNAILNYNLGQDFAKCAYCGNIISLIIEPSLASLSSMEQPSSESNSSLLTKEQKIIQIVDKYIHDIPHSTYKAYSSDELKDNSSILANARSKIGFRATGTVIGLVDSSPFNTGKDGIYFTTEGFAFDYAFEKVFLRYDEIKSYEIDAKGKNLIFHGLFMGTKSPHFTTDPSISSICLHIVVINDMLDELFNMFANLSTEGSEVKEHFNVENNTEKAITREEKVALIVDKYIHECSTQYAYAYDSVELSRTTTITANAKKEIGINATGQAVGLIDKSVFKNGKAGIFLTTDGIAMSSLTERVYIQYSKIESIELKGNGHRILFRGPFQGVKKTCVNKFEIDNDCYNTRRIYDMLKEILKLF